MMGHKIYFMNQYDYYLKIIPVIPSYLGHWILKIAFKGKNPMLLQNSIRLIKLSGPF